MSVRLRLIIGIPLFGLMFFYLGLRVYSRVTLEEYSLRGWDAELRDGRAVIADVSANCPRPASFGKATWWLPSGPNVPTRRRWSRRMLAGSSRRPV